MVLSLARATMFSSTTLPSSICSVHRAKPSGGVEQARAISLASLAPSNMRRLAEFGERLAVSTPSMPSSTSLLTDTRNRHQAGLQSRGNLAVGPGLASLGRVGLQKDARPQQLARRVLAGSDQPFQPCALLSAERDNVPLDRCLSLGHQIGLPNQQGIGSKKPAIVNDEGY